MKNLLLFFSILTSSALVFEASGYRGPERVRLENYDKRVAGAVQGTVRPDQKAAAARLKSAAKAQVHFDPVIGSAAHVAVREGFLTGADIKLVKADPYGPKKKFLDAHRDLFGHGSEVLRPFSAVDKRTYENLQL